MSPDYCTEPRTHGMEIGLDDMHCCLLAYVRFRFSMENVLMGQSGTLKQCFKLVG